MEFVLANRSPYLGSKVKALRTGEALRIVRWQTCEHVHFHQGIRNAGGKLAVLPQLVNGSVAMTINPSFFRSCVF
jgi:hypothetical protein